MTLHAKHRLQLAHAGDSLGLLKSWLLGSPGTRGSDDQLDDQRVWRVAVRSVRELLFVYTHLCGAAHEAEQTESRELSPECLHDSTRSCPPA